MSTEKRTLEIAKIKDEIDRILFVIKFYDDVLRRTTPEMKSKYMEHFEEQKKILKERLSILEKETDL